MLVRTFFLLVMLVLPARADLDAATAAWGELTARYVVDERWIDYARWHAAREDVVALSEVVDAFEAIDPASLARDDRLAFWINVYNAVTIELVLEHYPLESIKDIDGAGLLGSPWKLERVTIGGRALTLDQIEHEIIRPEFDEPRIHFAVNCASVGCPPLASEPYVGARLDEQLDRATRRAVNDPTWVDLSGCEGAYGAGTIRLTKIFDWFTDDFGGEDGIRDFLARHREGDAFRLRNTSCGLDFMGYDWALNDPPGGS